MRDWLIILLVVGGIVGVDKASADPRWEKTTEYVDELQASTADGVCIAIASIDGDSVVQHIAGSCNADNLFQIGSITKTFTGIMLADAILTEKVSLDTTLNDLLDQRVPTYEGSRIALVDLATHTSGLPRLPDNLILDPDHITDPYLHYGETELKMFLANHELTRAPGDENEYC